MTPSTPGGPGEDVPQDYDDAVYVRIGEAF